MLVMVVVQMGHALMVIEKALGGCSWFLLGHDWVRRVPATTADDDQEVESGLLGPAGARGIPHAFVVDSQGVVKWHGHPMEPGFEGAPP